MYIKPNLIRPAYPQSMSGHVADVKRERNSLFVMKIQYTYYSSLRAKLSHMPVYMNQRLLNMIEFIYRLLFVKSIFDFCACFVLLAL